MIVVEVEGLELFGHHGADEEERTGGQTFLFDVSIEVADASRSDRLADTVDYVAVAELVKDVSDSKQYHLLEALSSAVADAIIERFSVERVRVRVRKPAARPAGLSVAWTAATAERP
jgi:7,8-dihydroneopterin aldolase/epimerase/oxygenase